MTKRTWPADPPQPERREIVEEDVVGAADMEFISRQQRRPTADELADLCGEIVFSDMTARDQWAQVIRQLKEIGLEIAPVRKIR